MFGFLRWFWWSSGGSGGAPVNVIEFPASCCIRLDFSEGNPVAIDPRVGDIGTKVILRVIDELGQPIPLGSAVVTIRVKFGFNTTKTYPGILNTDGSDGKVYFLSVVDTWDFAGTWSAQALTVLSGNTFSSKPAVFVVGPNL